MDNEDTEDISFAGYITFLPPEMNSCGTFSKRHNLLACSQYKAMQ